jgi:FimV-like protein
MDIYAVKKYLLVVFFLIMGTSDYTNAQSSTDIDTLLFNAQELFDQTSENEALDTYLKVLQKDANNFEALWHTSLLYARIGYRMNSESEMNTYYQKSLDYAEQTLEKYPDKGLSHFVYGVANGRISDISGSKVRIEKSHIVKKHAKKAVEMLPKYAPAWHLLGLWHSKVANIGSGQRFAAGIFSKGVPSGASNEKAEEYIKKALELKPDQVIRFKLDLARHYERSGQKQKAINTLQEVLNESPQNEIDQWNLRRAEKFLDTLK